MPFLRKGVVVLGDGKSRQGRYVFVTGPDPDRARVDTLDAGVEGMAAIAVAELLA